MPYHYDERKQLRFVRQLREALELTQSNSFKFIAFASPGHFYSPIPDMDIIESDSYRVVDPSEKEIPGLDLNINFQMGLLNDLSAFKNEIPWPAHESDPNLRFHFDNDYFSYGDATVLYCMMRKYQPARIVEVGSGFSTATMLDVDNLFLERSTDITCIDPHAGRLRTLLSDDDLDRITSIEQPVQSVDPNLFDKLEQNDILFIDSSHVSKAGSDVNYLVLCVLPSLSSGVIIHIHDIFWPFEYPKKWLRAGRAWNEAYHLLAFLQFNTDFEILFFNSYLETHHRNLLRRKLPLVLRQPSSKMTMGNSSLWFRKK